MSSFYTVKGKLRRSFNFSEGVSIFLNPYSYSRLRKCPEIIAGVDNIYVDGILFVIILSFLGIKVDRVSFDNTSIAPKVFRRIAKTNQSVVIVGSHSAALEKFKQYLSTTYAGINLLWVSQGYFDYDEESKSLCTKIIEANPDYVIVGMGTPRQERFLLDLKVMGYQGASYTCGGFLHQTATKGHEYYPSWVNKLHIRFLYRIYDEPALIWRYSILYPVAVFQLLKGALTSSDISGNK